MDLEEDVASITDIREAIREQLRTIIRRFNTNLNSLLSATVILENGEEIQVPIQVNITAAFTPEITEGSYKASKGEAVGIKYGGNLHITLHKAACGRRIGNTKSGITLRELKLIREWGSSITPAGKEVLGELEQLGPPNNKRGLIMTAKVLQDPAFAKEGPLRDYLEAKSLIHRDLHHSHKYALADGGREWLARYAYRLYNYRSTGLNKAALVLYFSREQLAAPLASADWEVRNAADKRMKFLAGAEAEEPQQQVHLDLELLKPFLEDLYPTP